MLYLTYHFPDADSNESVKIKILSRRRKRKRKKRFVHSKMDLQVLAIGC